MSDQTIGPIKDRFLSGNIFLTSAVLIVFLIYFSVGFFSIPHLLIAGTLLALFGAHFALKQLGFSLIFRTNYCCLISFLAIVSSSFVNGGLSAPANFWLPLVICTSLILADRRSSVTWIFFSIGWLAFASFLHLWDYPFYDTLAEANSSILHGIHLTLMIAYVVCLTRIWNRILSVFLKDERQLIQSNEEIKRVRQITTLSSGFAHEINNPLAIASLLNQRLFRKINSQQYENLLEDVMNQEKVIGRMSDIVTSLSLLARDPKKLISNRLFLRPLIEEIVTEAQSQASDPVKITIKADNDVAVFANLELLRTLLQNLIQNAFDAVEDRPQKEIQITAAHGEKGPEFLISDNGPGIPDDQEIFDLFFTSKPSGKGTGIGLSLVKTICDNYGWKVTARNFNGARLFVQFNEQYASRNSRLSRKPVRTAPPACIL